jgi:hypothetical protein
MTTLPDPTTMNKTVVYDDQTPEETEQVELILKELTEEQIASFPDEHMPLRHLRAEKVTACMGVYLYASSSLTTRSHINLHSTSTSTCREI